MNAVGLREATELRQAPVDTRLGEPLLKAEGLLMRFGGVVAMDKLSLRIDQGAAIGIIGPNGAGKSTLIGLLGGALTPSEGRIEFDGCDITRLKAADRARLGIGRTYQIPRPFLDMTVRENLLAARFSLHPLEAGARARSACDAILERTGLADAAALTGRRLPLLRRKRLEVARALALSPKLLLLDEVGAGLVDSEVSELIDLVKSLRREVQGIVIIEHVLRVVRECCEQLAVINFGRLLAEGPTAQVLASDEVAAVYLGTAGAAKATPEAQAGPSTQAARRPQATPDGGAAAVTASPSAGASGRIADLVNTAAPVDPALPLLELRGIHAGYGQAKVLRGIDLKVAAGRVVAILGTNGAGKTTLSQVISGSITPTAGRMFISGTDVTDTPAHRIARLGLSQCMEGRRIFVPLSVEENLLLAARSVSGAVRAERLERVYDLFPDLKQRRSNGGTSMSGGQQQMLAIGRALMSRPRLVLFDEISLGLAPVMMDRLYAALTELRAAGLTMMLVEQDVARALDLADDVHVMEHGRFALSGTADSIRNDARLRQLYIGKAD